MNKFFLTTLLFPLLVSGELFAQKKEYFDVFGRKVNREVFASYYRTIDNVDGKFLVQEFRVPGNQLRKKAECKSVKPELVYHGRVINYFENGSVSTEETYVNGIRSGLCKGYGYKGNTSWEQACQGDSCKYVQYWYEGKPVLINGSGDYHEFHEDTNETSYSVFSDSVILASYCIRHDKNDTIYAKADEAASYPGGFEAFYGHIARALGGKYPVKARRAGIQGRVFVEFTVNKDGIVYEVKTVKGIGGGCDELAESAVNELPVMNWAPAMHNGQPVKSRMVLPIAFKLN